jgi:hypothetical protein
MKMTDKKYNGWTNYATWRINLEIFDGFDQWNDFDEVDHAILQDMAEEFVLMDVEDKTALVVSYAMAFMSDVNWHEIATHINEQRKEDEQDEDDEGDQDAADAMKEREYLEELEAGESK